MKIELYFKKDSGKGVLMRKIILKIAGMSCSACSNGLEKYLNKQEGISSAV